MPENKGQPLLRRSLDGMIPFFVGLALGFLTSVSAFSSRVSALEATSTTHSAAIDKMSGKLDNISEQISDLRLIVKQSCSQNCK